jgi:hypothetical protein
MYWDEMMSLGPGVISEGEARGRQQVMDDIFDINKPPMRFYLDVRQVEALTKFNPPPEFPPLVWSPTFIEFNGRVRYNQTGVDPKFLGPGSTGYVAIYIYACKADALIIPQYERRATIIEQGYEAYWFAPFEHERDAVRSGFSLIGLDRTVWPNMETCYKLESTTEVYLKKIWSATRNLLWFLAAENQVWVKITPAVRELHQKDLRGLPKSNAPYYVIPYQLPRYRYLVQKSSGDGTKHGHRYDVHGHLRHLVHPCFHRDADGYPRVVWVTGHQRGLDNEVYVPALRTGTIDRRVLEYDQFFKEKESRDRAQPPTV